MDRVSKKQPVNFKQISNNLEREEDIDGYRQGLDAETVLQAAIEMADLQGVEQLSLAALAAKLNVKTPSLYNHIKGLPDLRKQLSKRGLILLKKRWSRL